MKRIIDPDFLDCYTAANPMCEVAPVFLKAYGRVAYPDENGRETETLLFGGRMPKGEQVHHALGSGNGCQRHDVLTNVVHVSLTAHDWLERYKLAGMVLCCWVKREKGELDWKLLSDVKGKRLPGWFECDEVVERCRFWPWLELLRASLCGR